MNARFFTAFRKLGIAALMIQIAMLIISDVMTTDEISTPSNSP